MMWSSCPFCSQQVVSIDLERHANSHFEDEDLATDVQLANHYQDEESAFDLAQHIAVDNPMQSKTDSLPSRTTDDKIRYLINSQSRATNFKIKHGFITLLKNCLETESGKSTSILSGYVDHFQSLEFEDVGWGCGWRNIQMITSHLLFQRKETKNVIFGGVEFVPDILSLQRWLEIAWQKGFDTAGSNDFSQKIYGKKSWIGTTECAALFRSFGIRARIVDFCKSTRVGKRKSTQVIGPMDGYLKRRDTDASSSDENKDKCLGNCGEIVEGHRVLVDWVWSYFSDNMPRKSGCSNEVVVSEKAPLYFQHDGHSRTIVGIQLKTLPNGIQQHNLLILDPAHKTEVLESCLSKKVGWQRFIKRGVHTLKKMEYQLCYMDHGIATGAEMEKLKTLDSTRFEF